jgi:hypothetical protein
MAISGRWTITACEKCGAQADGDEATACWACGARDALELVEAVPCDDAAVERVARYLHSERFGVSDTPPCPSCLDTARTVLTRAAGGRDV